MLISRSVRQTFVFHQNTPLNWATMYGREAVVSYLKRGADPNMLEVCETVSLIVFRIAESHSVWSKRLVPLRIVVLSSGEALTLTDTS